MAKKKGSTEAEIQRFLDEHTGEADLATQAFWRYQKGEITQEEYWAIRRAEIEKLSAELSEPITQLETRWNRTVQEVLLLVRDGAIAPERAREVLGMSDDEFEELLREHEIFTVHYDPREVDEGVAQLEATDRDLGIQERLDRLAQSTASFERAVREGTVIFPRLTDE